MLNIDNSNGSLDCCCGKSCGHGVVSVPSVKRLRRDGLAGGGCILRHEGSDGNKVTVFTQITRSGGPGRQQYERNIDTGSPNCTPGGTGRELARKEIEAQPLWSTRRSLKEVAGKAGCCSLEAD